MTNAQVIWRDRMTFTASAESGFAVPLGSDPAVGGDDDGFRPMELLAVGLAGCTAMDVISMAPASGLISSRGVTWKKPTNASAVA